MCRSASNSDGREPENANDGIVTFTLEGTVTSVNRGLEAMLRWPRDELIGQHYRKFVSPAGVSLGEERTRRFLLGERVPSIFEAEMVRKDGSVAAIVNRRLLDTIIGTLRTHGSLILSSDFRECCAKRK